MRCIRLIAMPFVGRRVDEVILDALAIGLSGAAGAVRIGNGWDALMLDLVQNGREDAPRLAQLVGAHEMHLGAAEDVQNEALVGVRQHGMFIAMLIGEIQFGLLNVERNARTLGHHLEVERLARLHSYHQLVALRVALEDVAGHILILDADLGLALVQCLAAAQYERHALPALVVDLNDGHGIGGRVRCLAHGGIIQVATLLLSRAACGIAHILAQDHVAQLQWLDALQYLDLLITYVVRMTAARLLHGHQR